MHNSMMRKSIKIGFLALSCAALPAFAQVTPQESSTTISQPGQATKTSTVKASALITGIDKSTRTLTLKSGTGQLFDVVCGDEVRNFAQIKVGDTVNVEYVKSISFELKKAGTADSGDSGDASMAAAAARAEPGQKPAGVVAGSVTVVADVIDVNPEQKTITLKGPKGNVVELDVKNPDQFKVVKKGDHVMVTYSEAMAIVVEPAPKKAK